MNELFYLIIEFFKTGLFAVGGGLATVPFLYEIGEKYGWFTIETLSMMIAVSESTPGPMGVNMATYVGYDIAGIVGALAATLSLVAPSIIVISIIAVYLQRFKKAKIVQAIFNGLKPAVVAFIASATISLFMSVFFTEQSFAFEFINWKSIALFCFLYFVSLKYKNLHPIILIIISLMIGIIFRF